MEAPRRVLAIAAATGRIGCVYLIDGKLRDWRLSRKASKTPKLAAEQAMAWIELLRPEVVVTEKLDGRSRKGDRSQAVIAAIAAVAASVELYDIAIPRPKARTNKHDEAIELTERYPEIRQWLPKARKIWEAEPRDLIYFEALVLAENARQKAKSLE